MANNMYDRVIAVTSKPPEQRSNVEVEMLIPWFKKKSDLFSSLKTDVVVDILRNCEFSTRERDDVVIKQGEQGDCFYVILSGLVSVYINNAIADAEENENKTIDLTADQKDADSSKTRKLDRTKFGNFIVNIGAGKSFGELALINKDCIRNASIIVDETTDFLVVYRDLYNRSLRAAQEAEINEKKSFVDASPLFRNWAPRYKKQLAYSVRKVKLPFESTVIKQGDPVNCLYFVIKGQAKVIMDPCLHQYQYADLYSLEDPQEIAKEEALQEILGQSFASKKEKVQTVYDRSQSAKGLRKPSSNGDRRRKAIEVCLVGPNDVIGDAELSMDLGTYLETVVCTQLSELFVLDLKNYERLVTRRNPKTVDLMRHVVEVKVQSRVSRLSDQQIPLLRSLLFKLQTLNKPPSQKRFNRYDRDSRNADAVVPQRGPLINMFGPGTVFHRTRMREKARRHAKNRGVLPTFRTPGPAVYGPLSAQHQAIPLTNPTSAEGHFTLETQPEEDEEVFAENSGDSIPSTQTFLVSTKQGPRANLAKHASVSKHTNEQSNDGRHIARHDKVFNFKDFESSDQALSFLEERIKAWHSLMDSKDRNAKTMFKLRRVTLDDGQKVWPGKTIYIRKKRRGKKAVLFENVSDDDAEEVVINKTLLGHNILPGINGSLRSSESAEDNYGVSAEAYSDGEEETGDQQNEGTASKSSHKHIHHVAKRRLIKQYTDQDYQELKEMLKWRERAFGAAGLAFR